MDTNSDLRKEEPRNGTAEVRPEAIRQQLEVIVQDRAFKTSRRSVQFLRYVVEETLRGKAGEIKERTIGVEVFGREPSYDTAADHIVRTAAIELRKRLAVYYDDERHRGELRMSFVHGSYIPLFLPPPTDQALERDTAGLRGHRSIWIAVLACLLAAAALAGLCYHWIRVNDPEYAFWRPVLDSSGSVLLAVGDIPNGPPSAPTSQDGQAAPEIFKALSANVPYADTVTIARVLSELQSNGKKVVIRPEANLSFSDLRDNPAVFIGAFNNEWSLRLTHQLRFSLALDEGSRQIYIRDSHNPTSRVWSQPTAQTVEQQLSRSGPVRQDYAIVSRVWNPETGHVVVVIGGLYAFGTEAAGEFVTDSRMLRSIEGALLHSGPKSSVQVVLQTSVTDGTPGIAKVLAVDVE